MIVTFISECEKKSLNKTRRVLDQFAERKGARTWQTRITQQGLDTIYKMLKSSATKNTAVSCFWSHEKFGSELLWIVGNTRKFNSQGTIPTNTTSRNIISNANENDWNTNQSIRYVTAMAALWHDFGKASKRFQDKLKDEGPISDPFRHEWVSACLFLSFVKGCGNNDEDWLNKLSECKKEDQQLCFDNLNQKESFKILQDDNSIPPLAKLISWMIISHHKLPNKEDIGLGSLNYLTSNIDSKWGYRNEKEDIDNNIWNFDLGLPFQSNLWIQKVQKCASNLLKTNNCLNNKALINDDYFRHISMMVIMLADHYYSSQDSNSKIQDNSYKCFANTNEDKDKNKKLNQHLDEHLIGVSNKTTEVIQYLPSLKNKKQHITNRKQFEKRATHKKFLWQNKARDEVSKHIKDISDEGMFCVNMASTGSGKTLANIVIAYIASNKKLRANFALGLRTLTLQTGDEFKQMMNLNEDDLSVVIGSEEVKDLHEINKEEENKSIEFLNEYNEDSDFIIEGEADSNNPIDFLKIKPKVAKLLDPAISVSTIDYLIKASDSIKGGKQIAPILRLLTSDFLILDEPDDFGVEDLPSLARLVNMAGLLGVNIILSSATLPPGLTEHLFYCYVEGRKHYNNNRNKINIDPNPVCCWVDEFRTNVSKCCNLDSFKTNNNKFVEKRIKDLIKKDKKINAKIIDINNNEDDVCKNIASELPRLTKELHENNSTTDLISGKKVSFGIFRIANINAIIPIVDNFLDESIDDNTVYHIIVYHSKFPLIIRNNIENLLDRNMKRKNTNIFDLEDVKDAISSNDAKNHIFLVFASPVAEVGRDHDYDWAIIEPSSYRSITQMVGRIRRHRYEKYNETNVYILNKNIKGIKGKEICFEKPGFETTKNKLESHELRIILSNDQLTNIDSRHRIKEQQLEKENLVSLEHKAIRGKLEGQDLLFHSSCWLNKNVQLTGIIQKKLPFRKKTIEERTYVILEKDGKLKLKELDYKTKKYINISNKFKHSSNTYNDKIKPWKEFSLQECINDICFKTGIDKKLGYKKYSKIELNYNENNPNGWEYNDLLGFKTIENK